MESTLHQQLKRLYAGAEQENEISVDGFRIDAIVDRRLIEIQCSSLGAIRDKVRTLCRRHDVTVVKPVIARKRIVRHARRRGPVVSQRWSPRRETVLSLFDDLVHFTSAFPHDRLLLQVIAVEVQEHRVPRRRRRWRQPDYRIADRELLTVVERRDFRSPADFAALLPELPDPFTTADVAAAADISAWLARKAAYFLRETGAWTAVGKRGNARLYTVSPADTRAA